MRSRFIGPTSSAVRAGVIVLAAGSSQRMKGVDKVFVTLAGAPMLAWSVEAFEASPLVDSIVIVLGAHNVELGQRLAEERRWRKVCAICVGGERRQDSARLGLAQLPPCEWVLIHDGARPCLTQEMIASGLEAARTTGAAVASIPSRDTLKVVSLDGVVTATPDRATLRAIQTPQVFCRYVLEEAHQKIQGNVTDDASMVESLGCAVHVFEGSFTNIKVTMPEDLCLAETILASVQEGTR